MEGQLPVNFVETGTAGRMSCSESKHDDRHVIVLRRSVGKGVGRTKQALK